MKRKTQLKNITSYAKGVQVNGNELICDGEYDYLNGGINPSGKLIVYNTPGDTVTISEGGNSCGYVNFMKEPFWCGAHCYYLYDSVLDVRYLYYALKSQQQRLMCIRSGACMPNIKKADLGKFELEFETDENLQKEIVDILQKVEKIIYCRKEQLRKLNDLIKIRFIEMFGDPILNPIGWKEATVGDLAVDVRYGTSKPAVEGGQYPYLRMNNLTSDGYINLQNLKYIDIPESEIENCIVRKGDILFNRTNSIDLVGKTAVFDLSEEMVIAGYIIRVKLNGTLLPEVFAQYMNLEAVKNILKGIAKGAVNQANINAQELKSIKVYVPNVELQKKFVFTKNQIEKQKKILQKAIEKDQLLFDSLMQAYFG